MAKLTDKQMLFCREYLVDLNATQAALRAGYSAKTAASTGHENLKKPEIEALICELKNERNDRVEINADWVLEQAKNSFEFNAQEVMDSDGNPKMVNAAAASKFLELCGKHAAVKAFDEKLKDETAIPLNINFTVKEPVGDVKVTKGE